ncbi:MAG: hypothetical protein SFX72_21995 [Isosphaeraceae bacterium]|nr:hypothetical protein [Isosphaeraceae bacterium]
MARDEDPLEGEGSNDPTSPADAELGLETDDRFPSGEWTGFFLQPVLPGKHWMELHLRFRDGKIEGDGRDFVGEFLFKGRYDLEDGRCWWTKSYLLKHSIAYQGYNEGKGIWGTWEWEAGWKGGFRIWPLSMGDPTLARLSAEVEVPVEAEAGELVTVLTGSVAEES